MENAHAPKLASNGKPWLFAIGQLGWSMLSGIISNWLVYYYQPGQSMLDQGQQLFITQGAVFLGLTVIGIITAGGLVFTCYHEDETMRTIARGGATGSEREG